MKIAEPALHCAHIISPVSLRLGGPRIREYRSVLHAIRTKGSHHLPIPFLHDYAGNIKILDIGNSVHRSADRVDTLRTDQYIR